MTRLAVLHASVGTGQTAAASAICSWWLRANPDESLFCRDVLDYVPAWERRLVTASYLGMARKFPWFWQRLYQDTDSARSGIRGIFWRRLHGVLAGRAVLKLIADLEAFAPDAVVTTHFMGMPALFEKWESSVPFYFVDTDFGTHTFQRDPRFTGWFVAGAESARQHRADSLPGAETAVRDFGIPVAPIYAEPPSRAEARARLEVDPDARMILLSGGGIGSGPIEEIADSMIDYNDWRVEIVCGNNGSLCERLREKYYPFRHLAVRGFVDNMPDYYAASDVAIIKPGGLSAAEAASAGAAILLIDPLPGLERYNSDYLLEHGAARMIREKRLTGELVAELLDSPGELERMRQGAKSIARPCAAKDIIDSIEGDLEERKKTDPFNKFNRAGLDGSS